MRLEHKKYGIGIEGNEAPKKDYGDYKQYLTSNAGHRSLLIRVTDGNTEIAKAIVDGDGAFVGPFAESVIITDDALILCVGSDICKFSIPALELTWRTECDLCWCKYLYEYNNGYIVCGEILVTHLSIDGRIIWQRGGRDIFVTQKDYGYEFKISNGIIQVIDWLGYEYFIDKDGNCIKEVNHGFN